MLCYWLNGALCLAHENDEEYVALATLFNSFRAGLKPNPNEGNECCDDEELDLGDDE